MQEQVMHRASSVVVVLSVGEGLCSGDSFLSLYGALYDSVVILNKYIYIFLPLLIAYTGSLRIMDMISLL